MKIAILGVAVDSGNRGVHALGASTINLFWNADPKAEISLLLDNRNNEPAPFRANEGVRMVPIVNARMSPKSRPKDHFIAILLGSILYKILPIKAIRNAIASRIPWIGALAEADFVGDIRGGDSFSDIYGMSRFVHGFLMAWTVILVRGSMVQLPQTYGPYKSGTAKKLARYLLKCSSMVIARDKESQRVAQELLGDSGKVALTPDVAFSLKPFRPATVTLSPPLAGPPPSGVIGINVNGLMYNGGYTRKNMFDLKLDYRDFVSKLVKALLQMNPGEIWLIPHTWAPPGGVESDNAACFEVQGMIPENLRSRVRVLNREYDANEVKGIIGTCDFFIGSRMHSCIAALSQGIPCVGVAYSMKFRGVFESVGVADWVIDGSTTATGDAIHDILKLYQMRDTIRDRLAERANAARQILKDRFQEIVENCDSHKRGNR